MAVLDDLSQRLTEICAVSIPANDHARLLKSIEQEIPGKSFQLSLSRGGWYRVGGVVDEADNYIAHKLEDWAVEKSLDFSELWEKYKDAKYKVTRRKGITHYFTASTGSDPSQYLQLEVEEITEVLDRNLIVCNVFTATLSKKGS